MSIEMASEELSTPTACGLGDILVKAREAKNYTVEDIAASLKLRPRQINALEQCEFDQLPGMTYVRGIVRNYAKVVDLDSEALLAMIADTETIDKLEPNCLGGEGFTAEPKLSGFRTLISWRPNRLLIILAVILVVLALIIRFMPDMWIDSTISAVRGAQDRVSVWFEKTHEADAEPMSVTEVVQTADIPEAPKVFPESEPILAESVIPDAEKNRLMGQVASSPIATGQAKLKFQFEEDAWIEVKEKRSKKVILSGLHLGGTEHQLSGILPIELKIGNATAVKLNFNGADVALGTYTRDGVARLLLQ